MGRNLVVDEVCMPAPPLHSFRYSSSACGMLRLRARDCEGISIDFALDAYIKF